MVKSRKGQYVKEVVGDLYEDLIESDSSEEESAIEEETEIVTISKEEESIIAALLKEIRKHYK